MPSKAFLIRKLDHLFAEKVKQRDNYACVRCGKPMSVEDKVFMQCSHVVGKGYKALRWDMNNAKSLCFGCHKYWWHHPRYQFEAALWFAKTFPERLKRIVAILELKVPEFKRAELYAMYMKWI